MAQTTPLDDLLSTLDSVLSEHEAVHKQAVALVPQSMKNETERQRAERSKARKQSVSQKPSD